jgi:hypothetical protein
VIIYYWDPFVIVELSTDQGFSLIQAKVGLSQGLIRLPKSRMGIISNSSSPICELAPLVASLLQVT